jgi:hypothetical protein
VSVRRCFATVIVTANLLQLSDEIDSLLPTGVFEGLADCLETMGQVCVDTARDLDTGEIAVVQAAIDAHVARDWHAVEQSAEDDIRSIPGWSTWTEAEALAWFDSNITVTGPERALLRANLRLSIAMRNKLFPRLEGSQ